MKTQFQLLDFAVVCLFVCFCFTENASVLARNTRHTRLADFHKADEENKRILPNVRKMLCVGQTKTHAKCIVFWGLNKLAWPLEVLKS